VRTYEALYIVKPDLGDDEIQTIAKETETLVTDNGGVIVRSEIWGKRKLAYKVKHCTEGVYILLRFEAEPSFVARLENYFRLSEAVIRDLVVHFDEKTLRLEAEQQRRVEAEIRANSTARARREAARDSGDARSDSEDDEDDENGSNAKAQ
jgi:small subunit ribosomal protein S6